VNTQTVHHQSRQVLID